MLRQGPRLLLAAILALAPAVGRADLYRWVDESGATHYSTERDAVPRRYRGSAEQIRHERARRAPQAPPAETAPARPAPPPLESAAPRVEPLAPVDAAPPVEPAPAPARAARPEPIPAPVESAAPASGAAPASAGAVIAPAPSTNPAPPEPGPPALRALPSDDPRSAEIASLEAQIERDRELLRELISTPRWDSAELAADPRIREVAERLPRLQAELEALRSEPAP